MAESPNRRKPAAKRYFEVYTFHAEPDGGNAADEVAQHGPVAQGGVLEVVQFHAYTREYIDKHGAGIQYH